LLRLVIAVALTLIVAAPAHAVWEAPKRIDQNAEGFGNSADGDVAVGDNGLATILFLQTDDAGTKLWATRRAADQADWLMPPRTVTPEPTGLFTIEAAPDGSTAGAYRRATTQDDGNPLTPPTTVQNVFGLGWAADQTTAAAPKTGDLGDQADQGLPPVDADGRGFGWTAFIDADLNLQIVRFSLGNPTTPAPTRFTVEPTTPSPDDQNLNETLGRSDPQLDVNADGDVIVTFVEEKRTAECCAAPGEQTAVWAVRKLQGQAEFSDPSQISQSSEDDPVTDHDPAIVDNGDATILFGADPDRAETNRVFARRWLATGAGPRPESSIEFVSSSAANAPTVSQLHAEAGPTPQVTATWIQGPSQLNSAERSTTWTLPQTLSTNTVVYDVAVDVGGVATVVYREGASIRARRRAAGQQWDAAATISTAAPSASVAPRVDAGVANQADAYIVQADGSRQGAFATRFTGVPPVEPPAPVRPDTEDCPGDIDILAGDAGANTIAGADGRETIMGGDGDDTLTGNGGDDCIRGQAGNDTASGSDGNDDVGGGDGNDELSGGDGDDRLGGGGGTDDMDGDAGDDIAVGGDGNDTLDGSDGTDVLDGEGGDDNMRGGGDGDLLGGANGNDRVAGGTGSNALFGGLGNDRLFGGPERDVMAGEDGNDVLSGGGGPDSADGGTGNDRVRGGNGRNKLDGAEGDDALRGGRQADRILGSEGLDTLFGLGSGDRLLGGPDADRLRGGKGKDRLSGGGGGDSLNGGGARDRIRGGGGDDQVAAVDNKRDRINCGAGEDRVVADAIDRVSGNCETVRSVA
jgi:RTX calcium-binding nonapeptide repeat (4 copies)